MKKTLLVALGVGVALSTNAQTDFKAVSGVKKTATLINYEPKEIVSPYKRELKSPVTNTSNRRSFGRTQLGTYDPKKISSSPNCFGFLVSNSQSIVANKDLKTIVFANRGSAETKPSGWNSGWIMAKYSQDYGATWDSVWVYNDPRTDALSRYPCTMVLNPAGNTSLSNARIAVTGPSTGGSGWPAFHRSSVSFDGSNKVNEQVFYGSGVINNMFPRYNGSSSNNLGFVTGVLEDNVSTNTLKDRKFRGAVQNVARLNNDNTVSWYYDSIRIAYATDATGEPQGYETPVSAWSADGQIGYIVFYGVEQNATGQNLSFQPLVWKTSNGGVSWNRILVNYDWSSTKLDEHYLVAAGQNHSSGIYKPWFSQTFGVDAIVDANGELHLFTEIRSGSSLSIDSAGYTWTPSTFSAMLFDVSTKTDLVNDSVAWSVSFVDLVYSKQSNDAENDYGDMSLDARIQVMASEDRTKLFYVWVDTDTTLANGLNNYPDIFVKGRDLTNDMWTETYMISNDAGNAYWMYVSDLALTNTSGDFVLPITITEDNFAFSSTTKHNVRYVDNAIIPAGSFTQTNDTTSTGNPIPLSVIENHKSAISVSVSPNPTSGATNLKVNLPASSVITVQVYNTLGALVNSYTLNGVEGANTVKINLENAASGIYSYKVATAFGNYSGKIMLQNK